jgi:tetratricopeptide (TPR) repeat protein
VTPTPLKNNYPHHLRAVVLGTKGHLLVTALAAVAAATALVGCQSSDISSAVTNVLVPANVQSREKGITQYNAGDYADAAGAFNNAVRQDPRDYQSHYYLGRADEAMGSYQQSIQSYHTSLLVMNNSMSGRDDAIFRQKVLDGLASAIAKSEDQFAATASLKQKANPTAEDQFVLAKVMRIHGDADSAVQAYGDAARLDPNSLAIAREYGLYMDQLNQIARAKPHLIRAYQLNRRLNKPEDDKINAALRRGDVIPGPALMDEKDLSKPVLPLGPLPEVDVTRIRVQNPIQLAPEDGATAGAPAVPAGPHN